MKSVFIFCLVVASVFAISPLMVEKINSANVGWTASLDSPTANLNAAEIKRLAPLDLATLDHLPLKTFSEEEMQAAPDAFDARTQWPNCQSIQQIRDQSDCGSCWAFGSSEAMSDRECIVNNQQILISAEDMNSCSKYMGVSCGSCDGGQPACAWNYYVHTGVVSENCAPYSLPSCDHHIPNSTNPCPTNEYSTPKCPTQCTVQGQTWYKYKGTQAYEVKGEQAIMTEIMNHGPCETAFNVYDDFLTYTGGIYKHVSGKYDGGHAVKFVGWGVENGEKYWIVANSWNANWGEQGFFRILKGVDECGIENACYAGTPASPPSF